MVYQFTSGWTEEIAEVSTLPEFQNLTVKIIDPSKVEGLEYDIDTGVIKYTFDGTIWTGQARLVAIRWGVNRENSETANSNTIVSIQVQFPHDVNFDTEAEPRYLLQRGITMTIVESPGNSALLNRVFTVTSDIQSGATAARTIEFASSAEAVASTETPTEPEEPGEPGAG